MDKQDYPHTETTPVSHHQQQPQAYASPPGYQPTPPVYGATSDSALLVQPHTPTYAAVQEPMPDAGGMICFSCCVLWCCCWPLGLAAFIFAVMATSARSRVEALDKLSTAKKLSIAGLVCGVILITTIVIIQVTTQPIQPDY